MLQILLVLYFVEVLQKAYLAKKQDLCQAATAVSLTCIVCGSSINFNSSDLQKYDS